MEKDTETENFYKPHFCFEKFLCGLIALAIIIFSFIVWWNVLPTIKNANNEIVMNQSALKVQLNEKVSSDNIDKLNITIADKKTNPNSKVPSVIMLILFSIISSLTLVIIMWILASNDGGIRFAKLNELHNLRQNMKNINAIREVESEKTEEIVKAQSEIKELNLNFNSASTETSNININHNFPVIKKTKEKNLYSEFLKNYINAIVEI